jgi:hypothetical protein
MRLPWLLLSSAMFAVGVTAIALLCQSNHLLLRVALPTMGGLGVGIALDVHRRMSFLRHHASTPSSSAVGQPNKKIQ